MKITLRASTSLLLAIFGTLGLSAQVFVPQGRLTLVSQTPILQTDVTSATTLYYTPYLGNTVPTTTDGVHLSATPFSQMSVALSPASVLPAGTMHDVFVFANGSPDPLIMCIGPAWPSVTARAPSGNLSTTLMQNAGVWVNQNSFTDCLAGGVFYGLNPGDGVYLGSIYMTGAGETSVQFKPTPVGGGTNNVIGIWNAYNRVPVSSIEADSSTGWTYSGPSFGPLDSSNNNRITYLDGLAQTSVAARLSTAAYNAAQGAGNFIGISQDSTTALPLAFASYLTTTANSAVGSTTFSVEDVFPPKLGLHYLQAMQDSPNGTVATFASNGVQTFLIYHGDY